MSEDEIKRTKRRENVLKISAVVVLILLLPFIIKSFLKNRENSIVGTFPCEFSEVYIINHLEEFPDNIKDLIKNDLEKPEEDIILNTVSLENVTMNNDNEKGFSESLGSIYNEKIVLDFMRDINDLDKTKQEENIQKYSASILKYLTFTPVLNEKTKRKKDTGTIETICFKNKNYYVLNEILIPINDKSSEFFKSKKAPEINININNSRSEVSYTKTKVDYDISFSTEKTVKIKGKTFILTKDFSINYAKEI